jgi:hypothetical protein
VGGKRGRRGRVVKERGRREGEGRRREEGRRRRVLTCANLVARAKSLLSCSSTASLKNKVFYHHFLKNRPQGDGNGNVEPTCNKVV